jgi:TolA-binding protein
MTSIENMKAYLSGELSQEEKQAFEQKIAQDPGLVVELEELRQFMQKQDSEAQMNLRREAFQRALATQQKPVRSLRPPAWRVAAAAAVIILLVTVGISLTRSGDAPSVSEFAMLHTHWDSAPALRGNQARESLQNAHQAAIEGRYEAAIQDFENYYEAFPEDHQTACYLARVYALSGKSQQAIELLEPLLQSPEITSSSKMKYSLYLGLIYSLADQPQKATELLKRVQQKGASQQSQLAQDMLELLRKE